MNVWHFSARYYNFGDYALALGMRNIFCKWFSDRLIFKTFDTHDFAFDRFSLRHLNDTADLLLVGGGGLIHEFGGRWLFQMPTPLVRQLRVPAIFYGLGYNAFRGQPDIGRGVIANIRALQAKAISFSVRNDGSRERLERLGISAPEVADPGFFVDGEYVRPVAEPYVVVQLAGDCKPLRGYSLEALCGGIAEFVRHALGRGLRVVLAPHVREDIALGDAVIERLGSPAGLSSWDYFAMLREGQTINGLAYYKHAEFVVAMRGHSQICPMAMGTPVITVANHEKHLGLIAKLGLSPCVVEAADPNLGPKLIEKAGWLQRERTRLLAEYRTAVDGMTQHTGQFVRELRSKYNAALQGAGGTDGSLKERVESFLYRTARDVRLPGESA